MQEALCDAVKPQGGKSQAHILKALVDAGIPTASHIGLTPHTIAMFGGFKIQGRTADAAMKILEDALAIEDAGCFMLEFEAVPAKIAKLISEQLTIPTIGIGAGVGTDGQILLCYDLLGVFTDFKPKFTKRFAKLTEVAVGGIREYVKEVKEGTFPDDDHSYTVNDAEYEKFAAMVAKRQADLTMAPRARRSALREQRPARSAKGRAASGETLTEQAYRAIEEQIVTLRLKPGEVLSEQMLSATFEIGRTPIREALQRLAREGLVTILPRKGILVSDINPRNQLLVLEVRRELERLLSRAGAERATDGAARAVSARLRAAWIAPPRPTTTSPSCGSIASSTRCWSRPAHNDYAARSMKLLAGPVAALLVHALPARLPTCRCARGCTPTRPAPSPKATAKARRARQRQADGLPEKLHPRDTVSV